MSNPTTNSTVTGPVAEGVQPVMAELFFPGDEDEEAFAFVDPPLLVPDLDEERLLARQKEMMDACFGGIGEESKPEKRAGLAMQQLDIEQRHALRLLLGYGDDPARLTAHLERCLADPAYGYGERGDNGRTIAQGLAAAGSGSAELAEVLAEQAPAWLAGYAEFRQAVYDGLPMLLRSLHDVTDLETFIPCLQRVGDNIPGNGAGPVAGAGWRLGVENEGKHRDFQGDIWELWPRIGDAFVEWYDADNERWLEALKRQAARLPDTVQRAAWGDRLGKERLAVTLEDDHVLLSIEETDEGAPEKMGDWRWPRFITLGDRVGLSRLSGHSLYELAWEGGLRVRHFELSNTTRNKVPFAHTELAVRLAEALAGVAPEAATLAEIEAAYLGRMLSPRKSKVARVELGAPGAEPLPPGVGGTAVGAYRAGAVTVTMLRGATDLAYATDGETSIVLRLDERRGVLAALPAPVPGSGKGMARGRVGREPLMTTPLAEIEPTPDWYRALAAWAAWLVWATGKK